MPSTTPERAARWPGGDRQAIGFLRYKGWKLRKDFTWTHPGGSLRPISDREEDAIIYLIEEWDFGGVGW